MFGMRCNQKGERRFYVSNSMPKYFDKFSRANINLFSSLFFLFEVRRHAKVPMCMACSWKAHDGTFNPELLWNPG